jgi:septum formation protein
MSENLEAGRLVLASTSPRRQALLAGRGVAFEAMDPHVDEVADESDPVELAVGLAMRKARSVSMRVGGGFVLGADTVVWSAEGIFGKPKDRSDARRILSALSGGTHQVTTGWAVIRSSPHAVRSGHATSRVTMRRLTAAEIESLVASGEADDKAGAYAIQGAASKFITNLEGGRDTVIGLPVQEVLDALCDLGYRLPSRSLR